MVSINMDGPAFARLPPWVKAKLTPIGKQKIQQVWDWVETECIPAEPIMKAAVEKDRWVTPEIMHDLRKRAKEAGLFNLFLPDHFKESPGLTNLEYACCAEIMGRVYWAAQVSCSFSSILIFFTLKWDTYECADNELPCS
jgi:acyl-CoA dehydrogenase